MPKTGTLTKAHIIDEIAETNGFTRIKAIETAKIMMRRASAVSDRIGFILSLKTRSSGPGQR